ncbi:MARVEL domain-containing protein 3 isoform X2 [Clupea harengus]|nr:MARVEL domain-containing protein 3 isoform X2 [Clupea harengus]XP_031425375.1 MARVEL domain-containing protein 3 isoform X2 [Clupea harengus]
MPESDRYRQRDDPRHKSREREQSSNYTREDESQTENYYERRNRTEYREERNHSNGRSNTERNYSEKERDAYTHPDRTNYDSHQHQGHRRQYTESPVSSYNQNDPQRREALYNLRYLGTGRGICQAMEAFLNMLIIICAGVSHSTAGQYRDLASLGGVYAYYFGGANAFTGAEADRVKQLDKQFYQLKLPPYIFSMACGGALMGYACAMLFLGIFRVPFRWPLTLLVEAILNGLIGLGYIPAVAFYFIKLQETYNHPICKEREELYKSKGHQGFQCSFHGADIAGGLFGVLGIFLFPFAAVLAIKAFRAVRERKKQRELENEHL